MISTKDQDLLRHKVRYKLMIQWPSAPREAIEDATEKAVVDVRENDDWLFDMMVDIAIASAKQHLHEAVFNGTA